MGHQIAVPLTLAALLATVAVVTTPTAARAQTAATAATVGLQWFESRDERAAVERGDRPQFPVKTFADFDVAGDGAIGVDEWLTVVAAVEGPEAFARALFEQVDRDGDGTIGPAEFAGMTNADLAAASAAMEPSRAPADVIVPMIVRSNT